MPVQVSYPGVYVEELPSAVRTITGVPTSITAFVGRAWRGPVDEAVKISSYADYERTFGGLWRDSTMSYAVQQFFLNGGSQAVIVRVATRQGASVAKTATFTFTGGKFKAASPGSWGMNQSVTVEDKTKTKDPSDGALFNLKVLDDPDTKGDAVKRGGSGAREAFLNVSVDPNSPRFVTKILEQQSQLLRVDSGLGTTTAPSAGTHGADAASGTDGTTLTDTQVIGGGNPGDASSSAKTGMFALLQTDIFNLLCIPPYTPTTDDNGMATWTAAATFCKEHRAFLLVDAPASWKVSDGVSKVGTFSAVERAYAAIYFPRIRIPDPLQDNNLADFAPCGAMAGIMSRTDAERGVWKAPAGIEAGVRGVLGLSIAGLPGTLTDSENGDLNPLGVNCLRAFPNIGHVAWGARTLEGSDVLASQWKYIPVRRLALYLEESLFRGTQWVVFEPNDEPLWAQIRLNVGAFMQSLFRQAAFQGATPREAYLVKCDKETTTQDDINRGVVNILVGFAPLKPAEFVVIQIQQLAGQIQT
jgi:phage tail sheath protein FI